MNPPDEASGQVDIRSDVPQKLISEKYSKNILKYIELFNCQKKIQISQRVSDWEPSEIYISLSFLYIF